MDIQQHDGVAVEVAGIPVGLRQALTGGRGVTGGRGRRQGLGVLLPSLPPLYIGPLGGRRPWIPSTRGAAARGETSPPSQVGAPHPQGFQP